MPISSQSAQPFDIKNLAIMVISTSLDKSKIPGLLDNIRTSLFSHEPTFVVVDGDGEPCLAKALNKGFLAAKTLGCTHIAWAHPDM